MLWLSGGGSEGGGGVCMGFVSRVCIRDRFSSRVSFSFISQVSLLIQIVISYYPSTRSKNFNRKFMVQISTSFLFPKWKPTTWDFELWKALFCNVIQGRSICSNIRWEGEKKFFSKLVNFEWLDCPSESWPSFLLTWECPSFLLTGTSAMTYQCPLVTAADPDLAPPPDPWQLGPPLTLTKLVSWASDPHHLCPAKQKQYIQRHTSHTAKVQ